MRRLAEQPLAARQFAVRELQHEPLGHVVRADRETARRRRVAPQLVALVEQLRRASATHATMAAHAGKARLAVAKRRSLSLVDLVIPRGRSTCSRT